MVSVNAARVQSRQSLHFFRTCTKWAYLRHMLSFNTQTRLSMHAVCQRLHCSRTYTKWVYIWHLLSVNAQTNLSHHSSNTCTKWVYIWHIPSVNDQTRLSMRTVSPEPSLLSHMRKLGVHTAYSFRQYSDET